MQVAVIGPLQVRTDDGVPVPVPGAAERLLLAALAAATPAVASADVLIRILEDGAPPAESLRAHVVRLRSSLQPGLPPNASGRYVVRRGAGYVLVLPAGDIDAARIGMLLARGRARLAAGDPAEAARLFTTALRLWRGEPYADWPHASFAEAERRRLIEVRTGVEAGLREAQDQLAGRALVAVGAQPAAAQAGPSWWPEDDAWPDLAPPPPPHVDVGDDEPPQPVAAPAPGRRLGRTSVLVGILVGALVTAGLAVRSQRVTDDAVADATAAQADRLAAAASAPGPLDVSLLLAAQAFRLADTPTTRRALLTALVEHPRVQRVVRFSGAPTSAALSGGGTALSFRLGADAMAWSVRATTRPYTWEIPTEWRTDWITTAPAPTHDGFMAAGLNHGLPWVRMVSVDGDARLLAQGDAVGGRPVEGAVSEDGRRIRLIVSRPDEARPYEVTQWRLVEVDTADGRTRDSGIGGTFPGPDVTLAADFADDAGSFVLWDKGGVTPALLVDVTDGRRTTVAASERRGVVSRGFRALSSGAAQMWDDGTVTLVDRGGRAVQELSGHDALVHDLVVAPDRTWAATADDAGRVVRWHVDPSTGRWFDAEPLAAHAGEVVDVAADASSRFLFTVSLDQTAVQWDMGPRGASYAPVPGRPMADLEAVCAVVRRDLTDGEWRHFLPGLPYTPTCSDLR